MISGANLMDYRLRYNTKDYVIKRIKRAVIPYLFWSCFAFLFYWTFSQQGLLSGLKLKNIINLPLDIINNKYMRVYWFFLPLFICYLSIIILSRLIEKKDTLYFITIWIFLAQFFLPFLANLFHLKINPVLTSSPLGGGFVLYILLGYFFSRIQLSNTSKKILYLIGIISLLARFFSLMLSPEAPAKINRIFTGYINIATVFYSLAIFLFVKYISPRIDNIIREIIERNRTLGNTFLNCLEIVRDCSLGIYLLHPYFTHKLIPLLGMNTSSIYYRIFIYYRILGPFVIVCICCTLTLIFKKFHFYVIRFKNINRISNVYPNYLDYEVMGKQS